MDMKHKLENKLQENCTNNIHNICTILYIDNVYTI